MQRKNSRSDGILNPNPDGVKSRTSLAKGLLQEKSALANSSDLS
jgi:hypothetical protein